MADKKISQLTLLAQGDIATTTDVLAIVDTSATETKKATPAAIVGAAAAAGLTNVDINSGAIDGTTIGANSAAAGTFTNLTASGTVSFSGATVSNGGSVTTVDINGGTIDGASVGASSASTGAFTTLTTSSTVTLNGGTANGVLYLNGSKVATSGSALTFDGSGKLALGNVAHTSFIPTTTLTLGNSAANAEIRMGQQDTSALISKWVYNATVGSAYGAIETYGQTNYIQFGASDFRWQVASSEQMRLTSTGLGIGTSSPTNYGATYKTLAVNGSSTGIVDVMQNGTVYGQLSTEANVYKVEAVGASTVLRLVTNSATRATLDTSGNLGLGVTPNPSWEVTAKAFQISDAGQYLASGGTTFSGANQLWLGNNGYLNSSSQWIYLRSVGAAQYRQLDNTHAWFIAPSGTAGNTISFTQAMTLDADGDLGVGETAPDSKLHVKANGRIARFAASTGTSAAYLAFSNTGGNYYIGADNSAGNALLATGGAAYGFTIVSETADPIVFGTDNTERARITSGGDLLVGATSNGGTNAKFEVDYAGSYGAALVNTNDTSATKFYAFYNSAFGECGSIARVTTTNAVTYNTTSDYRLKTLISSITNSGDRIDALNPVEYEWKENGKRARGFFAHEFQQVYADSVTGEKDAVDKNGNPIYQAMQAATSEVIADLVAEIKSLRARVAQLESK